MSHQVFARGAPSPRAGGQLRHPLIADLLGGHAGHPGHPGQSSRSGVAGAGAVDGSPRSGTARPRAGTALSLAGEGPIGRRRGPRAGSGSVTGTPGTARRAWAPPQVPSVPPVAATARWHRGEEPGWRGPPPRPRLAGKLGRSGSLPAARRDRRQTPLRRQAARPFRPGTPSQRVRDEDLGGDEPPSRLFAGRS